MRILTFIFDFILLWQSTRRFDDWKVGAFSAILVFLVAVGFILLILVLGIFGYKRHQKRSKSFQAFAAQDGWNFVPNESIFYFKDSSRHLLFRYGDWAKRISPLIQKPFDGGQIFVFDYFFTVGSGRNSKSYKMTAVSYTHLTLPTKRIV